MAERNEQVLTVCPGCGCREMFVRKAFPQRVGLGVVVVGAVVFLVCAARPGTVWVGWVVLGGMVVVDLVLYAVVGRMTVCYRCRREYRGPVNPAHGGFELAVGEKYRSVDRKDVGGNEG